MKACSNLVFTTDGKTLCKIYQNRLGKMVGEDKFGNKYYCTLYNSFTAEIAGCPMNEGTKPLVNVEMRGGIAIRSKINEEDSDEVLLPKSTMIIIRRLP